MIIKNQMSFDLIVESLINDNCIRTIRGCNYIFIKQSPTKIKGILFEQGIHYRISDLSSKRITFCLIRSVYDYYQVNSEFPTRAQLMNFHSNELSSRPCNYSVACSIVWRFVK